MKIEQEYLQKGQTMKKITVVFVGVIMLAGTNLFAGSLDYLSNQSAKWVMTTSRNASLDGADIIQFNPAGTAYLDKGFHLDISGQTLFKYYGNKDVSVGSFAGPAAPLSPLLSRPAETLKQDYPSPIIPNAYLAYNFGEVGKGRLAAYTQIGIVAGGGELKWNEGTAGTTLLLPSISAQMSGVPGAIKSQEFDASSIYYGIGVGVSYAFAGDMVSVSFGGRSVMANRSFGLTAAYTSSMDLNGEYEYKAKGFTPIVGINVRPTKDITLAARFEAPTSLEFEYKQKELGGALAGIAAGALQGVGITDGGKARQDLPTVIGVGAGYNVNDRLTLDLSGMFYLLSSANLGDVYANGAKTGELNDYFDTGWELGLGATYKVTENLKFGAGALYSDSGAKETYLNDARVAFNSSANPMLNSVTFGTGITYSAGKKLDFTCSFLWSHYLPENFSLDTGAFKVSGKYTKDVLGIGYGVSYRF